MRRLSTFSLALAALVATVGASGCGGAPSTAPVRPPALVRAAIAQRGTVPFVVRAPGLVVPGLSVEVHSRIDSQVMEVNFAEGDVVRAGQLLFTLDDRALQADLKRAEATLVTSLAELQNAKRQFERARKLASGGFESTSELDRARADYEGSEARVGAIRAEIERFQVLIGYTKITSAIDGRAGVITATVGNTVKANDTGTTLVVINQVSPLYVQFGLPQQILAPLRARIAQGAVSVRVIRDGVQLDQVGRVQFVDNGIKRSTATFESRAEFANEDESLWPGMIVELVLSIGEDVDAVSVPDVAVQRGTSGDFVFVIDDLVARRRMVKVRRYGEGLAVIESGLTGGETVAVDGMLSLSEGSPVEILEAKPNPGNDSQSSPAKDSQKSPGEGSGVAKGPEKDAAPK